MKHVAFLMLVIFLVGTACNVSFPNVVQGSGKIVSQSFDVSGFDQVDLNTTGTVFIKQGDAESLTIETDENILPLLNVKVEGGKLMLTAEHNVNFSPSIDITYRIKVKSLSTVITNSSRDLFINSITGNKLGIFVNASGNVTLKNVQTKDFSIESNGSGAVKVDHVEAQDIQVQSRASGNVDLAGKTDSLTVEANGSGDVLAGDLKVSNAEVDLQASGYITVWALGALDVTIGGSGKVSYYGKPRLSQTVTASGILQSFGEK